MVNEIRSSRAPAARVDQPWRSSSRGGGTESDWPGMPSTSDITVASPHQRRLANSAPVLPCRASVVSRVSLLSACGGCTLAPPAPSRRASPRRGLLWRIDQRRAASIQRWSLAMSATAMGGSTAVEKCSLRPVYWAGLRSQPKGVGACRVIWAAVAEGFQGWAGPHDLQPQRCSGLSPCALPARPPDQLGR